MPVDRGINCWPRATFEKAFEDALDAALLEQFHYRAFEGTCGLKQSALSELRNDAHWQAMLHYRSLADDRWRALLFAVMLPLEAPSEADPGDEHCSPQRHVLEVNGVGYAARVMVPSRLPHAPEAPSAGPGYVLSHGIDISAAQQIMP